MGGPALGCDVRAIFFDAVGTVIHPDPPAAEIYAQVGRQHGSRLSAADIRPRFAAAFQRQEIRDREAGWRTSEERESERWRTIVSEVLADANDPDACFAELFAHFRRPDAWRCAPDVHPTLTALAKRGYRLGLASNYDRRLYPVAAGLLLPFAPILISSEVGWRKPSCQFFAALCDAVALPPEAILLVGDDLVNDYEGARQAGLQALLFDPQGQYAASPIRRITHLRELLA